MAIMTDAAKKKSETAIRKAYNDMDTASFTAGIAIEDLPANILITGVTVELLNCGRGISQRGDRRRKSSNVG